MSVTAHTETKVAWHELDNYCGERDPEETLQNVRNWSIIYDGFPKFEVLYCSQNIVKSIKIQ